MSICVSCYPFEKLGETFSNVYVLSYDVIGPYLANLMASIAMVVMLYGIIMALFRPSNVILEMYLRNLVMWVFVSTLLLSASSWFTFFNAVADIGPYLGTKVISQFSASTIERTGLVGILEAIEVGYLDKLKTAYTHWVDKVSFMSRMYSWAGSVMLGAVFLIVSYQLFAGILRGHFKIIAIGILSPFIVFFAAFDSTRSISIAGMRVLLAATMELFVACIITATLLFLFDQMQGEFDFASAGDYFSTGNYFLGVLMTGVAMLLVHSVFTEVIGQITLTFGTAAKASLSGLVRRAAGLG